MVKELKHFDDRSLRSFEIKIEKFNKIIKKYGVSAAVLTRSEALKIAYSKYVSEHKGQKRMLMTLQQFEDNVMQNSRPLNPWQTLSSDEKQPWKSAMKALGLKYLHVSYAPGEYWMPKDDTIAVMYQISKEDYTEEK